MYLLLRLREGWITNDDGDFYVEDTEQKCRMWVPNNLIGFSPSNEPYFKNQGSNIEKPVKIVDISHEFNEGNMNAMLTSEYSENLEENTSETTIDNIETAIDDVNCIKNKEKTLWSLEETLALITTVEGRYDDMHHVHKRKTFWSIVREELASEGIEFSEIACKKKWLNLVRTYKNTKDLKSRTGRGPVKFAFYDRLDELLGDSPSHTSPHSLDVSELQNTIEFKTATTNPDSNSEGSSHSSSSQKRKNPSMELVKVKKKFFEEQMEIIKEKEMIRKHYVEESLKYKKDKLDLYKNKLEIEREKVKVLQDLQKALKERKT